jgi:hypothetical protein
MNRYFTVIAGMLICVPAMGAPVNPTFDGMTVTGNAPISFPTPTAGDASGKPATTSFVGTAVGSEAARAAAAEATKANISALTSESTTARAAESANATAITSEASTARAAEGTNATAISTEASRATAAEATKAPITGADLYPRSVDNTLYCARYASPQACHDALPSTGGKMMMPPNVIYAVTATINISKPNVTIECPSWGTVFQRAAAVATMPYQVIYMTGAGDAIKGCTVDGNGSVYPGAIGGDLGLYGVDQLARDVQVIGTSGNMAVAVAGQNGRIAYSKVVGLSSATIGGYGIWAINHVTVTIDHNTITGTKLDAIGFDGAGSQVSNNTVYAAQCYATINGRDGGQIAAYPGYYGMSVSGNTVGRGCAAYSNGIESDASYVTITGNTLYSQQTASLTIDPGAIGATITGNTIHNGTGAALVVQSGAKNITITGNGIVDDRATPLMTTGILVTGGAQDNLVIQSNDFTGVATPVDDTSTGRNKVISGNLGIDNVVPSVASSYVMHFPINPVFTMTGTTGVAWAETGPGFIWVGRVIKIIPVGVVTFTAGNNIANSYTTTAGVPFTATFDGTLWHFSP